MTRTVSNGKSNASNGPAARVSSRSNYAAANPFVITVSVRFLCSVTLVVVAVAFSVGRVSVGYILRKHGTTLNEGGSRSLPLPVYPELKSVPRTVYSSKHYDTGAVSTSDTLLARRAPQDDKLVSQNVKEVEPLTTTVEVLASGSVQPVRANSNHTEETHEPSGQHLLVDIKGVDGVFLNSEERLATAMVSLVKMSGLTLLSYHCHKLPPIGVSCVGVLLESHISFHTWPIPGAISLDLFTCGPGSLLPILSVIEEKFGVPRTPAIQGGLVEKPFVQWAHKKRGFRSESGNPEEDTDVNQFLLGWMEFDMKERVISVETEFQTLEIYDVINPRFRSLETYKKSLAGDNSYEAQTPQLFRPDRVVYLDGIMQSRLYGEAAYHESLVHPAMIAHTNPKRVAIIGGGEGATLREVLKHNTVEKVTMIEIDEVMVKVSREYIPEWSDCSMLVGSAPSCFDDPRAEVFYTDAIAWFIDRFADKEKVDISQMYDIIIMDALDPSSVVEFSDVLYDNDVLVRSLTNALGEEGIIVAQVGESEKPMHAGAQFTSKKAEMAFTENLMEQGFMKIEDYSDFHGGFMGIWKYKIAMKSTSTFSRWHYNQALIDLELQDRAMPTLDGSSPFRYFDGATMAEYQYPSRVIEDVFCRNVPTPVLCEKGHGFDPERPNAPISTLEVKVSPIPNAGRGIFANEDIPEGTLLAIDESVHDILMMPETTYWTNLFRNAGISNRWRMFDAFMFGYGFVSDYFGEETVSIDGSILEFLNHGCDGSYNLRMPEPYSFTEMTADPLTYPAELDYSAFESQVYNPYISRNHLLYQHGGETTDRDIKAGEELLDFYLNYYTKDVWERGVTELRAQCLSHGIGSVSSYDSSSV